MSQGQALVVDPFFSGKLIVSYPASNRRARSAAPYQPREYGGNHVEFAALGRFLRGRYEREAAGSRQEATQTGVNRDKPGYYFRGPGLADGLAIELNLRDGRFIMALWLSFVTFADVTVKNWRAKLNHALGLFRDFRDEKTFTSEGVQPLSRLQRFAHFCLLVAKSFSGNRCPMRASGLAYTTLLALIPMLFVVLSVSSSILKKDGGQRVNHFVDRLLVSMTPPAPPANLSEPESSNSIPAPASFSDTTTNILNSSTNLAASAVPETASPDPKASANREQIVKVINGFMRNIQSGTLGVTGVVALVFMAISMLSSIESTFNDIWGVPQGRSWLVRIEKYGAVLFMGPLLLAVALGLSSEPHFQSTKQLLHTMPIGSRLLFQFLPVLLLCLSFSVFYRLIPNTTVHWRAAFVGGFVGGILWHLNNYFSILYVSRWVTNSKIYGSLAVLPVFMVGLYVSWLIVLFGAQVAYAWQNRAAYLAEKQVENISQRGREFVALRLMECVGQRFQRACPPATVPEMAEALAIPSCLVVQIMNTLLAARLVIEVAGDDPSFAPSRPLETITCHDILLALRAGQGQELATRDDSARAEVFGEFERILAAEKQASSSVTILAMVNRVEELPAIPKAMTDGARKLQSPNPNIK